MRRICTCGAPITTSRLSALPACTTCIDCARSEDVPKVQGIMVYDHKTAPSIYLKNQRCVREMLHHSRRGVHAQLPMQPKRPVISAIQRERAVRTALTPEQEAFIIRSQRWYASRIVR